MVRQAVRQAHGPEQRRRTHHPEQRRRVNTNDRNSKFETDGLTMRHPVGHRNVWLLEFRIWILFGI